MTKIKFCFRKLPLILFTISLGTLSSLTLSCNSGSGGNEQTTAQDTVSTQVKEPVSARPAHWGYDGDDGPSAWASLDPVYALCGTGKGQSPINIEKKDAKGGTNWHFDYKTTSLKIAHNEHMDDIIDNGHTIQVSVNEGSDFTFGDKTYHLKQFHFHTPSEHTIDGKHLPMEMHLVHQSEDKSLAVVSVFFEEGKANDNIAKIVANLPNTKGESKHLQDVNLELNHYLPEHNHAYHYMGSLTTPPCSEQVQWVVLQKPLIASTEQIKAFSSRIGANNRPIQPANGRTIDAVILSEKVVGNK